VPLIEQKLDKASRKARRASLRSWFGLVILAVVGIGAVALWIAGKNATAWTFGYCGSMAGLIAWAANDLGVFSETTSLLRTFLTRGKSTGELTEPAQPGKAAPDKGSAALVLARRFEAAGQRTEAEHAYRMAVEENDNPYALYWLGKQRVEQENYDDAEYWLRRAMRRGNVDAAFLLGTLTPDDQYLAQHNIADSKLATLSAVM
jgi:TPR repeat protein